MRCRRKSPFRNRPAPPRRRSCRRRRSRCRRCSSRGGDVAFREALYLMALAFGRLHTCREAFGRTLGLTALAVHRADRRRLSAGQRGRVDPRAGRPHPSRGDPCHHRGRPADRQGPADQAAQHARPPERAGPAVGARAKTRSVRSIRCCGASTICCSPDVSREDFAVVSRFLEQFALNSEYALAEIRRSERERAAGEARRAVAAQD